MPLLKRKRKRKGCTSSYGAAIERNFASIGTIKKLNCAKDDLYLQSNDRGPFCGPQSQQALRGAHTKPTEKVVIPHNKVAVEVNKQQRVLKHSGIHICNGLETPQGKFLYP